MLWSGDVMAVLRASAKKVVTHHALRKQENRDPQEHNEQELRKSKPR
jgi:hypothetical protein